MFQMELLVGILGSETLDRAAESACAFIVAPGAEKFERCVETLSGCYIIEANQCGVTHSLLKLKYIQVQLQEMKSRLLFLYSVGSKD